MNQNTISPQSERMNNNLVFFTDSGPKEANAIVFIHGMGLDHSIWKTQIDFFSKDFRIICYDIRGHGNSGTGDGQYSIDLFVDDLVSLLDHLNIPQAILCGLSMGGYIALRTFDLFPERVKGLILCETKSHSDSNSEKTKRFRQIKELKASGTTLFASERAASLFNREAFSNNPELVSEIRNILESNSIAALCGTLLALASRVDTGECLKKINVPTLILAGENDDKSLPLDGQYLNHFIAGSKLEIISGAGRLSNMEKSDDFNNILAQFLISKLTTLTVEGNKLFQSMTK
jgi:3-oxoadipate enol-lactonase